MADTLKNLQYMTINKGMKHIIGGDKVSHFPDMRIQDDSTLYAKLLEKKRSTFDRGKFTVGGSPTITDDGIVSGFSRGNYIQSKSTYSITASDKLIITGSFITGKTRTDGYGILSGLGPRDTGIILYTTLNTNTAFLVLHAFGIDIVGIRFDEVEFIPYQKYYYMIEKNLNSITLSLKKESDTSYFKKTGTFQGDDHTSVVDQHLACGRESALTYSIDAKYASLEINGIEVFNGNKIGIDQIKKDNYTNPNNVPISQDGIIDITNEDFTSITTPTLDLSKPSIVFKGSFIKTGDVAKHSAGIAIFHTLSATNETNTFIRVISPNSDALHLQIMKNNSYIFNSAIGDIVRNKKYFIEYKYEVDRWIVTVKDEIGAIRAYREIISDYHLTNSVKYIPNNPSQYGGLVGYIDLNDVKVYSEGNLGYQPTLRIPYTQAKTDEKIVDAVYRDRVQDMYEQFGYTHYYTLGDVSEKYNVQVVGSPTLVGGVVSGFSSSNYLNKTLNTTGAEFVYRGKLKLTTIAQAQRFFNNNQIRFEWNGSYIVAIRVFTDGSQDTNAMSLGGIDITKDIYYEILINNNKSIFTIWNDEINKKSNTNIAQKELVKNIGDMRIGVWNTSITNPASNTYFYLSQFSIEADGKEVFRGYEPTITDAFTLATNKGADIIDSYSDGEGTYYEIRADLVQRCVGQIPINTTEVNYPREFRNDKNIVQVAYFNVGESTATPTIAHIAPKVQTKSGFTIGATTNLPRNYYAEGKAVLG